MKTDKAMFELPIIDPMNPTKKHTEKEEKWLREPITCEFMNLEQPGLLEKFTYGSTKKKHTFTFFHGARYVIPRFIKQHIESKGTPIWKWVADGSGRLIKQKEGVKPRFAMREVFE